MEERKLALIPRLTVTAGLGPKEYGVLLTDQRFMLIMEKSSKSNVLVPALGLVGALIAEASATERGVDYMNAKLEDLARDEGNLCIPYASVQRLRLKKHFGGSLEMRLEYALPDGKRKKLAGMLMVPDQLMQQKKASGMKFNDILDEYQRKAQDVLRRTLPPGVQQNTEWFE